MRVSETRGIRTAVRLVLLASLAWPLHADAFAEDACPVQGGWETCAYRPCSTDEPGLVCESIAMLTTFLGSGEGRRSTIHMDATYLLAQAAGFSPRDAYWIAAYDQAPDYRRYVHRSEDGQLMAAEADCEKDAPPAECALNTEELGGTDRNNFVGGGLFFHFMAPPVAGLDGLAPNVEDQQQEPFLHQLRAWLYRQGPLCVGGLDAQSSTGSNALDDACFGTAAAKAPNFVGHIPFVTELGWLGSVDWQGEIEEQALANDPATGELRPASELGLYLPLPRVPLARLGIYLHALQDRISHHRCNDASAQEGPRQAEAPPVVLNPITNTIYQLLVSVDSLQSLLFQLQSVEVVADPDYVFDFSQQECDQPAHASRHTWEVGFPQDRLAPEDRTTRPGLEYTFDELVAFAKDYGVVRDGPSAAARAALIDEVIVTLEERDANQRIRGLTALAQRRGWLPLPLHGGLSLAQWDAKAGSHYFQDGEPEAGDGGAVFGSLALLTALLWRFVLRRWLRAVAGGLLMLMVPQALAWDFGLGPVEVQTKLTASAGAAWRLEDRATQFIGKTNVEGQQTLCAADSCMSFTGDPAPNQRLVDAEGGYYILNGDNGNLNYDQGDVTYATTKLVPKINASWGDWQFKASGYAYYDAINYDFDETHPNTLYQPASTPRSDAVEDEFGLGAELRELVISGLVPVGRNDWSLSVGRQVLRWGESNTILFNTVNQINPLDARIARMPGVDLSELPKPVPAVVFGGDIAERFSAELVYLFGWEPVTVDPAGSFMSTSDVAGGGSYAIAGLGQFSEDPDGLYRFPFPASLATDSSATVQVLPDSYGEPHEGDEYGLRLNYFDELLLGGLEASFYYLHYHSRLPYASAIAADASCARDSDNALDALIDCRGFNGSLDALVPGEGLEPIAIDTLKLFLEYPEDLDMFGLSFNTNAGSWALAGELAYHPEMPMQVQIVDLVFSGLQPAFPRQDLPIGLDTLTQLTDEIPVVGPITGEVVDFIDLLTAGAIPSLTLPGSRTAVPDFLSLYRGEEVLPGQVVQGWEAFDLFQLTLNGLKSFRANPLGADQIILLIEGGLTWVPDLPDRSELQLEGGGDNTHASPGADGTGLGGEPDPSRFNPTQQTRGFADAFSWGYRVLGRLHYANVWRGINVNPSVLFQHDVHGIAPFPMQNFIEDRMNVTSLIDVELNRMARVQIAYQAYFGAEEQNLLVDRDSIGFAVILDF